MLASFTSRLRAFQADCCHVAQGREQQPCTGKGCGPACTWRGGAAGSRENGPPSRIWRAAGPTGGQGRPASLVAASKAATLVVKPARRSSCPCLQFHPAASKQWAATREDALSSGKAPSSSPPDSPIEASEDFDRLADQYLGGLWDKLEEGLRAAAGEVRAGRFSFPATTPGLAPVRVCLPLAVGTALPWRLGGCQ